MILITRWRRRHAAAVRQLHGPAEHCWEAGRPAWVIDDVIQSGAKRTLGDLIALARLHLDLAVSDAATLSPEPCSEGSPDPELTDLTDLTNITSAGQRASDAVRAAGGKTHRPHDHLTGRKRPWPATKRRRQGAWRMHRVRRPERQPLLMVRARQVVAVLIVAALACGAGYLISLKIWPETKCGRCGGGGRNAG